MDEQCIYLPSLICILTTPELPKYGTQMELPEELRKVTHFLMCYGPSWSCTTTYTTCKYYNIF